MEFTPELLEKAKKAESAEALQALAKENNYDMSAEEAEAYFAKLHKSGELSDEELENVSGGGCRHDGHLVVTMLHSCDQWKRRKDDPFSAKTCNMCYYCHYEKGLWLCYNPNK